MAPSSEHRLITWKGRNIKLVNTFCVKRKGGTVVKFKKHSTSVPGQDPMFIWIRILNKAIYQWMIPIDIATFKHSQTTIYIWDILQDHYCNPLIWNYNNN